LFQNQPFEEKDTLIESVDLSMRLAAVTASRITLIESVHSRRFVTSS